MESIIVEIIKLVAVVLTASLASGGLIMYYIKKHDRVSDLEKKFDRLTEGVQLGLENDIVIFKALRQGHINGESEAQEKRLNEYFFKCATKGFELTKE